MKRFLIVTLILGMVLLCTGCSSAGPDQTLSDAPGYSMTYNGIKISMNADAAPIISALGDPKNYSEEASCAFEGLDKTYYYGNFYLSTYHMDGEDYVYSLWFADDNICTEEGIRIGSTQAEVEAVYGTDSFNGTNAYALTKGGSKLTVILMDGLVSSIQYEAIVE